MKTNVDDRRSASDPTVSVVRPSGLFELTLEVSDLAVSERFYHDVIGLALGREGFLGLGSPETG